MITELFGRTSTRLAGAAIAGAALTGCVNLQLPPDSTGFALGNIALWGPDMDAVTMHHPVPAMIGSGEPDLRAMAAGYLRRTNKRMEASANAVGDGYKRAAIGQTGLRCVVTGHKPDGDVEKDCGKNVIVLVPEVDIRALNEFLAPKEKKAAAPSPTARAEHPGP